MTQRRRQLFGLSAALVAVALAVWLLGPRTAITAENAEKIQVGMTRAEVEALLGGPARDEAGGALEPLFDGSESALERDALRERLAMARHGDRLTRNGAATIAYKSWESGQVVVLIGFQEGRVDVIDINPARPIHRGPLDRLRRWLGR
jgi:hypothetical protein